MFSEIPIAAIVVFLLSLFCIGVVSAVYARKAAQDEGEKVPVILRVFQALAFITWVVMGVKYGDPSPIRTQLLAYGIVIGLGSYFGTRILLQNLWR